MTSPNLGKTDPLYYQDAATLAALIASRQISSREVVQAHLDRVAAVNPQINAVVTLMADDALRAADVADQSVVSGATLGPLHGVPFSIKDASTLPASLPSAARSCSSAGFPRKTRPRWPGSKRRAASR